MGNQMFVGRYCPLLTHAKRTAVAPEAEVAIDCGTLVCESTRCQEIPKKWSIKRAILGPRRKEALDEKLGICLLFCFHWIWSSTSERQQREVWFVILRAGGDLLRDPSEWFLRQPRAASGKMGCYVAV